MAFRSNTISFIMVSLLGLALQANAKEIQTGIYGLTVSNNFPQSVHAVSQDGFKLAVVNADKTNLDVLQREGMKGLAALWLSADTTRDPLKWQDFLTRTRAKVLELKAHPSLFAWYLVDEPDGQGIDPAKLRDARSLLKTLDPATPVLGVLDRPLMWSKYLPLFDIIAVDPYMRKTSVGYERPDVVKRWLQQLKKDRKKLKLNNKLWVVLGAFDTVPKDGTVSNYLKPTPAQFASMVDMSVAEGVDGILVYTYAFKENDRYYNWNLPLQDPPLWEAVRAMPLQIKQQ